MNRQRDLLLVDAGVHPMAILAARLRRLDFRVAVAKTPEEAHHALVDPRRAVGALVIPPDLPVADLGGALRALRGLAEGGTLPVAAAGPRPGAECRRRLRAAGVDLALWEPMDAHSLRFQVNRALATGPVPARHRRKALRVPASWGARVTRGRRSTPARLYSLSTEGAFLATERPALRGTELGLTLALPAGPVRLPAQVVMTNVPGNLVRRSLPFGMAVRFGPHEPAADAVLHMTVEERARELEI